MSEAGREILNSGIAFAGLMRQNRRDAQEEKKIEDERMTNVYASKLMQANDFQGALKDIPEEYQANAFQKAMSNAQSMMQADAQYQNNLKAKEEQSFRDFQDKQRIVDAYLDNRNYRAAAPILAEIYNRHIKDGQTVDIDWGNDSRSPSINFHNKYTGDRVSVPLTEDEVKNAAGFTRKLSVSRDDFSELRKRDSAGWSAFNINSRANMKTALNDKGDEIKVFQQVPRGPDGSYDPDNMQLVQWVPNEGPRLLPAGLPEGWHTVEDIENKGKAAKSRADVAVAGANIATAELNKAKARAILGGGVNQPDYRNAWQGNDGKWYAETLGGTVEIDPAKAKQETMHVLGGLQTNPETGEAQVAVQKGNKITAQTIEGMKVGSKGMVSVQDPDSGKQMLISKEQAKQLDHQLKMGKELLENVKDANGNPLALLLGDPSQMTQKDGVMLVDKLNRVIQDPKASREAKHAANSVKFVYQAYGVMPLDREGADGNGARGKKTQAAPPSAFKQGWDLYQSLKDHPDKQQVLLDKWRQSNDAGAKEVARKIEEVLKKKPKMGGASQKTRESSLRVMSDEQ